MKHFFLNVLFLVVCNSSVFGMDSSNLQQDIDRARSTMADERLSRDRTVQRFQGYREKICAAFSAQENVKNALLAELGVLEKEAVEIHDQSIAALQAMLDYYQERVHCDTRVNSVRQSGSITATDLTPDARYQMLQHAFDEVEAIQQDVALLHARTSNVNTSTQLQVEAILSRRKALIEKMEALWGKVNQLAGTSILGQSSTASGAAAASAGPKTDCKE